MELNQITLADAASARLIQISALCADLQASDLAARGPKRTHLDALIETTVAWAASIDLPRHLAPIRELGSRPHVEYQSNALISEHSAHFGEEAFAAVLIDATFGADWPKGSGWAIDRAEAIRQPAQLLYPGLTSLDVASIIKAHRRAVRRLRKDSVSVKAQMSMGVFMAAAAAASGGAATAVGTAVGTQILGLSGAAATSAGLAFLGGGSLAAGGFGMAGGQLLVNTAAFGVKSASKALLGAVIAKSSSTVFISELAKLDVLVSVEPGTQDEVVRGLGQLKKSIGHERVESEGSEAKNLAASERAIEYEIRHLESPRWKRLVAIAPRVAGIPAFSKLLDRLG